MTPSQARNAIKKALVEIVDPKPKKTEIDAMWRHFNNQCAFCGKQLERADRIGHADHLVPAAKGGHNHIYNRVLACSTCNGDQKLDSDWQVFLDEAKGKDAEKITRKMKILEWQVSHRAECSVADKNIAGALNAAEEAIHAFNTACDKVRSLRT